MIVHLFFVFPPLFHLFPLFPSSLPLSSSFRSLLLHEKAGAYGAGPLIMPSRVRVEGADLDHHHSESLIIV